MPQGLDPAGLDGHAEGAMRVPNRAHLALLSCLADHDGQLVGNDGVQDGDDNHGEQEGHEGVNLRRHGEGPSDPHAHLLRAPGPTREDSRPSGGAGLRLPPAPFKQALLN